MIHQLRSGLVALTSVLFVMMHAATPAMSETSGLRAFQRDMTRAMQRIDRQLCSKLPGMKCRQGAARPQAAKKSAPVEPLADTAAAKKNEGATSASAAKVPPIPKLKPPAVEQDSSEVVILPKLKPVKSAATDVAVAVQVPQKSDRMQPPPPPSPKANCWAACRARRRRRLPPGRRCLRRLCDRSSRYRACACHAAAANTTHGPPSRM